MTPGSLLLASRSSPVAIASACWTVYVENNGWWQMAAHQPGPHRRRGKWALFLAEWSSMAYRAGQPL